MRAIDVIVKKRDGGVCTKSDIVFLLDAYLAGDLPDYQMVAFLMATYFQGMSDIETAALTEAMMDTGSRYDFSDLDGVLVDKHSTGGVGDTVSLLLAPVVAAAGVSVPMMSGRSLGHTGGTLDKLETIAGYRVNLSAQEFRSVLVQCGYAMTGQTRHIVPADKRMYALRDVTGTVESMPLIVSSILSKKFAEGCQALVLDVKYGSGAFMKSSEDARELARRLVTTAKQLGKPTVAILTPMQHPLGNMVGNFLEVEETVRCLSPDHDAHRLSQDLVDITVELGGWMLLLGEKVSDLETGKTLCREALENGSAWERFCQNVALQGGNIDSLLSEIGKRRAPFRYDIIAPSSGTLSSVDAYAVGVVATQLGAGRSKSDDEIRPDVGVELHARPGDLLQQGDPVLTLWYGEPDCDETLKAQLAESVAISDSAPAGAPFEVVR